MRNYAGSALMLFVTMAAAVGCYTVNLRVSAERAAVERLQKRLVADARDIRTLEAELRTRARFPEMQRWNDGVFQMSAPAAGQFLRSAVQLASYGAAPMASPAVQLAVVMPQVAAAPAPVVNDSFMASSVPQPARMIRAGFSATPSPRSLAVDLGDVTASGVAANSRSLAESAKPSDRALQADR